MNIKGSSCIIICKNEKDVSAFYAFHYYYIVQILSNFCLMSKTIAGKYFDFHSYFSKWPLFTFRSFLSRCPICYNKDKWLKQFC